MNKEQENQLLKEAITLLRKDGTRFTVDDLANNVHVSKKTIYLSFPSKEELAQWIYKKAFSFFDKCLSKAKNEEVLSSESFSDLLFAYSDLLSIAAEETFNRYSLNPSLKDATIFALAKRRSGMEGFLKKSPFSRLMKNPSFLLSFDASLLALSKSERRDALIEDYASFLEGIVC